MEKDLQQLVDKLKTAAGSNLKCVVLYGSAATGEFHPEHSDLNVLCVLQSLPPRSLEKINPVTVWWVRRGHPAPLLLSLEELGRFADVFAIELLDIKAGRRVLFGEDVFAALPVPLTLHRAQVERELESSLIRLRQSYLGRPSDPKALVKLMTASVSTFATLFRHTLIALGEQAPTAKREVFDRLATLVGFDAAPFHAVLDLREGRRRDLDGEATFYAFLQAVTLAVSEVDRRLVVPRG